MPSGADRVVVEGNAMIDLVRAVGALTRAGLSRFAVVGGVAVTARLGRTHRATADVDTVVDETTPPAAVQALLALDGAVADPTAPHRVYVDDTKVEILGVGPIRPGDLDGVPERNALFGASHVWALETASLIELVSSVDRTVSAVAPFATPAALVAMKLHAIEDRSPAGGLDKRAGDAWDILRLLTDLDTDGEIRSDLAAAPGELRALVRTAARRVLIDNARRTQGWLRAGDDAMAAVSAADLAFVGERLLAER